MRDTNAVSGAKRFRKHTKLKAKRKSAADKGVTLVEGALVAVRGKEFSVYVWDEVNEDYVPKYTGTLD